MSGFGSIEKKYVTLGLGQWSASYWNSSQKEVWPNDLNMMAHMKWEYFKCVSFFVSYNPPLQTLLTTGNLDF